MSRNGRVYVTESDMTGPATKTRQFEAGGDLGLPPDVKSENARELYLARVVRLGEELERLTKLISWARECLENELMSGLGYKKLGISDKDLAKLKSLSSALLDAVNARMRYDKASKDMADTMTPAEEFDAMWAFVKTLTKDQLQWMYEHIYDLKQVHIQAART